MRGYSALPLSSIIYMAGVMHGDVIIRHKILPDITDLFYSIIRAVTMMGQDVCGRMTMKVKIEKWIIKTCH